MSAEVPDRDGVERHLVRAAGGIDNVSTSTSFRYGLVQGSVPNRECHSPSNLNHTQSPPATENLREAAKKILNVQGKEEITPQDRNGAGRNISTIVEETSDSCKVTFGSKNLESKFLEMRASPKARDAEKDFQELQSFFPLKNEPISPVQLRCPKILDVQQKIRETPAELYVPGMIVHVLRVEDGGSWPL